MPSLPLPPTISRRQFALVAAATAGFVPTMPPTLAHAMLATPTDGGSVLYVQRLTDDPTLDSVYAHLNPDTTSDVVWSLPYGTPAPILRQADGQKLWYGGTTWYEVALPYGTGWLYGPLLDETPPSYVSPPMAAPVPEPASAPKPPGPGRTIVVSLADQFLWAFDGTEIALAVGCTTGGRDLETPTGDFTVKKHVRNYHFNSPWPKSSQYYYDSVEASYALRFYQSSYFLHDAPWRRVFGRASQGGSGKLGKDHTGSHGCVNLPYPAAQFLFSWASDGTPVRVI